MPDWVVNELTVTGTRGAVDAFHHRAASSGSENSMGEDTVLEFQRLLPMPNDVTLAEQAAWRKENWGVDGGAVDVMAALDGNALVYVFETAWSPPLPLLMRVSQEELELTFQLDYRHETGNWTETVTFVRGSQIRS